MILELISRRATKGGLVFATKKLSAARKRRQEILSTEALSRFAPKHYPCIFLDRRLKNQVI